MGPDGRVMQNMRFDEAMRRVIVEAIDFASTLEAAMAQDIEATDDVQAYRGHEGTSA